MTPLFHALIHTAMRSEQKKEHDNAARKSGGITALLFYGMFLAMILLIAWLASSFLFE